MAIVLYNTRTKRKEGFQPLQSGKVNMYVCGVTVYDDCHLGHARSALTFDLIRRYFEFSGFQVRYVRNFTDIDDKILNRAQKEGVDWKEISERYIQSFYQDMGELGISKPTFEPRATDHIPDILKMVEGLVDKDFAYPVDGDVYFSVEKFSEYGQLSGKNLGELQAGVRIEVDPRKRDPMDFAVWKASKSGEPAWESPWGKGRPGWHIECSAMSVAKLGETFDIHGGGKDLIFPHHENEIAQSCAYTGKEFARYWLHNGFVTIDKEKMSKSLGNFFTIREIFEKSFYSKPVTAECLRYFLFNTHYRSDVNFSERSLPEAHAALTNFYDLMQRLEEFGHDSERSIDDELVRQKHKIEQGFSEAMDDDFNTPKVLATFHDFRTEVNKLLQKGASDSAKDQAFKVLKKLGEVLGIFQIPPKDWSFKIVKSMEQSNPIFSDTVIDTNLIKKQIQLRKEARERKDFAAADRIRKELAEKGIVLEDRPDGTTRWKR